MSGCLRSMNFSLIINWRLVDYMGASRGLRQGGLFSPFLFIVVLDRLRRSIKIAKMYNLVECIYVGTNSVKVSP